MSNNLSTAKRIRQSEKRNLRNRAYKSRVKTYLKKILAFLEEGKSSDEIMAVYKDFVKLVDKLATRGIYHKNTVARKKSRIYKKIKEAGKAA